MKKNAGFTLIELMIVVAIIAIIAAIAIPNLLRSRLQSNEAAAIGNLRTVNGGETAYHSANSQYGTYAQLTGANPPFIDNTFADGAVKQGYTFGAIALTSANQNYTATAVPVTFQTTGNRSFFTDTSGIMRASDGTASVGAPTAANTNPLGAVAAT
jgi:prepilin-type N-terminal cleavage/methylation domain-containing protein